MLLTIEQQGLNNRDVRQRDCDGCFHNLISRSEANGKLGEGPNMAGGEAGEEKDTQLVGGRLGVHRLFLWPEGCLGVVVSLSGHNRKIYKLDLGYF